jgi:flagellar basal-body rod modification protein FlgD
VNVTATNGTGGAAATDALGAGSAAQRTLGQDAFLKLLITQLENQDPSQPKEDTEFISQLAVFSQLEKLTEISASLKTLTELFMANTPDGTDAAESRNQQTPPASGA